MKQVLHIALSPNITFFVGILSFMNSASRHRTCQGAWIFKKPIPRIWLWKKGWEGIE